MTDITEPAQSRSPRRTIVITLAVLVLSWLAFPGPVASWVSDSCIDWSVCPVLQTLADAIDNGSRSAGVADRLEAVRDSTRATFGIDFY